MENTELRKQIESLNDTIEMLNKKLADSEALKGNFISNVMNEVYNPFSSIITLSDNILSLKDNQMEEAKKMAEYIYLESSKLDFHLQNIFTAATIEAGLEVLELRQLDMAKLHDEVIEKLKINIKSKNINIIYNQHINKSDTIIGDSNKIKLILINLLSNSIKNCTEKGNIICNYEHDKQKLKIDIVDDGPGISDKDLETIFNRFEKISNNINSVTGGAGLGLSVVKALIELMDGEIKISNKPSTKVEVIIPTDQEDANFGLSDDGLFGEEIF